MYRLLSVSVLLFLLALPAAAADTATPIERLKVAKDFKVELLYSVPREEEGSWVNLCVDPKGRLIVSDQHGSLYRVTVPALGTDAATKIEKIPADIGEAQGLLWAFDSLYVVVNKGKKYDSGLYRVRDTNGDDQLDEVKLLQPIPGGGGEHGPHAVLLHPDGKRLTVVCGNQTKLLDAKSSRVPRVWGEDHLLPRMPDGKGFMRGVLGPGGAIYNVDPEGKNWEIQCVGFRNQFDAAYNRRGDLFTYDADMEWDFNTPWYRPTRVCLAASGAEFGWRNGAGKWPAYYPDSLPSVVDVGPGSPTGVCFGYGAKFPAKYQDALFICDWSYGKLYAVHLTPEGSAYRGEVEEFINGTPLPLTDVVINPLDGAMYFTIGGRRTQSGLYRVTYAGKESTASVTAKPKPSESWTLRRKLETLHGKKNPKAVETAWPHLASPDRYVRFAARVALEHQDVKEWQERALTEKDPAAAIQALLALTRVSASDPFHRKPDAPSPDLKLRGQILEALTRIDWKVLSESQRADLLRVYEIVFNRMGKPDDDQRKAVLAQLDAHFPAASREVNAELCQVLVYLEAPNVAARAVALIQGAPTQEEQMEYARSLRVLKTGWTPETRKAYFEWFARAAGYKGGASFSGFMNNIRTDAVTTLSDEEKVALKDLLEVKFDPKAPVKPATPRPLVKQWKVEELLPLMEKGLKNRNFDRGRQLFGLANCFACHRYDNEGGANGPDLTGAAGRFSVRDLLESIVEPSKVISDQYQAVVIETTAGKTVTGRIVNLSGENIMVNTDMTDPNGIVTVTRKQVESMSPSKVSMMPAGLLDTFKEDEILDLMAYLLSRGNRNDRMFSASGN